MISRRNFYFLLFIAVMVTYVVGTLKTVSDYKKQEGLVFSDDGSKSFQILDSQILINVHHRFIAGGGNAVSFIGDSVDIKAR